MLNDEPPFPMPSKKFAGQVYFKRVDVERFKADLLGIEPVARPGPIELVSAKLLHAELDALGVGWCERTLRRRIAAARAAREEPPP
jgi:hypothetical protein